MSHGSTDEQLPKVRELIEKGRNMTNRRGRLGLIEALENAARGGWGWTLRLALLLGVSLAAVAALPGMLWAPR